METRWGEHVILDYEIDFPTCTALEWSLYSLGAAEFTRVLLGDAEPWGVHRRPGILEITESEYTTALERFAKCGHEKTFVEQLTATFARICTRLEEVNKPLETDAWTGMSPHTARLLINQQLEAVVRLMAFHVLNWAIPFDGFERRFGELLGSRDRGRECLMRLLVPTTSAHLTDFFELAATASHDLQSGALDPARAAALADAIGHLQAPGLAERSFEDGQQFTAYLSSLDDADLAHIDQVRAARLEAERTLARQLWILTLATDGSAGALDETAAMAGLCRLAAEEEEQRRRWQGRSLRNLRRVSEHFGFTLDELVPPTAKPATTKDIPPLLAPSHRSWGWLHADRTS